MGIAFFQGKIQGHPSIACKGHGMTIFQEKLKDAYHCLQGRLLSLEKKFLGHHCL
jgi:hypothetical protein